MGVEDTGILASEEKIKADSTNANVWFHQTPKYNTESTNQSTMARFNIQSSLVSAIKTMYKGKTAYNSVLGKLLTKLEASGGFIEFFLTNISTGERDRYVLSETVGDNFAVFGLGKEPEIISCTGILKNTKQDDWQVQFMELFNKIGGIRALGKLYQYDTSTGKSNKNFLSFKYNNRHVRGALLNTSTALLATNEMDMALSFSFLVTKEISSGAVDRSTSAATSSGFVSVVRSINTESIRAPAGGTTIGSPRSSSDTTDGNMCLLEKDKTDKIKVMLDEYNDSKKEEVLQTTAQ